VYLLYISNKYNIHDVIRLALVKVILLLLPKNNHL